MPRPKMKNRGGPSIDDEIALWEYIYENMVTNQNYEEIGPKLFESYLKQNDLPYTSQQLAEFYSKTMEPALYKANMDVEKILSLYKNLEIEISPHVETMLEVRCGAGLRIDADRCLIHYTFFTAPKTKRRRLGTAEQQPVVVVTVKDEKRDEECVEVPPRRTPTPNDDRMPHDVVISPDFDSLIWKHVLQNAPTLTANKLMSVEFWDQMLENCQMGIKSPYIVLRHFHGKLLKKLYKQKLGANLKMRLIKELLVPMSHRQKRYLLEAEGVDVLLDDDGYVQSWEEAPGVEDDDEVDQSVTIPAPKPTPPPPLLPQINIANWTPRIVPQPLRQSSAELFLDDEIEDFSRPQSAQHSVSSRTHSVCSRQSLLTADRAPKMEDDMTWERRRDKRTPFTYEDDLRAWKYILQRMYDGNTKQLNSELVQPKGVKFWGDYIRQFNSPKTASNWSSHFRKKMCSTLHDMGLANDTKLMLYTHLDIPVTQDVVRILESRCSVKIKVGQNRRILSWRWLNGEAREQTIDTEPLINDDEETDGESITAAIPSTNGTEDCGNAVPSIKDEPMTPSTSTPKKKRKSDEDEEEAPSPSPTPPPLNLKSPAKKVKETRVSELNETTAVEEIPPLDLKLFHNKYMNYGDLLAAIQRVMIDEDDSAIDMINEAVVKAFTEKDSSVNKCNNESVARHKISESISKAPGRLQRALGLKQQELIANTVDRCENQEVFRKRVNATSDFISSRIAKMNSPVPPPPPDVEK
uniref:SPK domain-containing protein n=1 Tax=Caenorhabditis japonica TaxID=281687 RepID=A0A8R1HV18_CAEJA